MEPETLIAIGAGIIAVIIVHNYHEGKARAARRPPPPPPKPKGESLLHKMDRLEGKVDILIAHLMDVKVDDLEDRIRTPNTQQKERDEDE